MHILCKALVRRQDGIDLIRISIIEPFGWQLLIRESVKHRRGWSSQGLSGAAQNSALGWDELQPHPAAPSLGQDPPSAPPWRGKTEIKLQEAQQAQDAVPDPCQSCHHLSHSSSTSHAQGGLRAGGSPGEPRQLQFVSIRPVKSKEVKWQQRVINQSVPPAGCHLPLGEGYSPAKWGSVS